MQHPVFWLYERASIVTLTQRETVMLGQRSGLRGACNVSESLLNHALTNISPQDGRFGR